ncbi:hypothetical protein AHAS_Ahas14G0010600 [Arachis hypogaea]|uniref:Uncharacterized protein n=1 Tax=Arachis hypogaea TaxID=3818 RepID=A0A444ZB88_ARAHY|nr:hypothetical protein Ahy_B04g068976 [Arachis hypogaea]
MDPRPITRCGCEARIKVHVDDTSGRWFVEQFCDNHNHPMLDSRFRGLMQSHRAVKEGAIDAEAALKFLATLRTTDCGMFWKYSLDGEKRLENLFWCDGTSRYDYNVFGDVLEFNATYGRNKYKCPLVIFSGVNRHMRTVVFGCAILSNESEKSYSKSIVTDRDLAMKSVVSTVFLDAHHRLCSWHLLRNATARVGRPGFLRKLRLCLMGDLEVDKFERI